MNSATPINGAVKSAWELTVLDPAPPTGELASLATGDIDGDGHVEIITGGQDVLLWYRPATQERGTIAEMHCTVGVTLEDIDGDGRLEVVLGDAGSSARLLWFKAGPRLEDSWACHVIDADAAGHSHDVLFADLDSDGENELIANAVYCSKPGLYAYKRNADSEQPWRKFCLQSGFVEEGLRAADLDGDGQIEIVSGPDWYHSPVAGPFSGLWERRVFAPAHREMCRVALLDVTGSGRPDILLVDSEYLDGRLSWFENRLAEDPQNPWIEHILEDGLVYAHSLHARHDSDGQVRVFCAEMGQGGWDAPRNWDARLIELVSSDKGASWQRSLLYRGEGTHEATLADIDGDGDLEIVGKDGYEKINGKFQHPRVQIWKRSDVESPFAHYKHRFLDRDKPDTAIDLVTGDIDGDGIAEVICGRWWYRLTDGKRHEVPGIHQILAVADIDGDGRPELIAIKPTPGANGFWNKLSSILVWLKPVDLEADVWEEYPIGVGQGNWPHGTLVAPLLPGGRLALITGYHNAISEGKRPEIWEIPADPTDHPWPKRDLAEIAYGEEFVAADIDGDGKLDLVAGAQWLENRGDGTFAAHPILAGFEAARVAVADIDGDGRPDVVLGEEVLDFEHNVTPRSALIWCRNPADPTTEPWTRHVIDTVRCAHSIAAADLDGDGEPEIICGEHDPFWPYRTRCRLFVYKKADPASLTWKRFTLDDRFEHHDGTKIIDLGIGRKGILSHGWKDNIYVHLWEPG